MADKAQKKVSIEDSETITRWELELTEIISKLDTLINEIGNTIDQEPIMGLRAPFGSFYGDLNNARTSVAHAQSFVKTQHDVIIQLEAIAKEKGFAIQDFRLKGYDICVKVGELKLGNEGRIL